MNGLQLILTLKDDCVFSERAATEGGHRGLDHVPGAAILGAVASRVYGSGRVGGADAFTLFHSGRVHFGNGLPLADDGRPGLPVPLCWHYKKGDKPSRDNRLLPGKVFPLSPEHIDAEQQTEQMRSGYVTPGGEWLRPKRSLRLKTAIDPDKGSAEQGALFGYEGLNAGQRFAARITWDANLPEPLVDTLRRAIPATLLLGRSRSAEYGLVEIEQQDLPEPDAPTDSTPDWAGTPDTGFQQRLVLWAVSDLAPVDEQGMPTLHPLPQWLGLPEGRLVTETSFIRARRYSPWNSHRRGPDLERQVISQGSVLVFDLEQKPSEAQCLRLADGIGLYREAGLGQVLLDPALLAGPPGEDIATNQNPATSMSDEEIPQSDLIDWLCDRQRESRASDDNAQRARELAKIYRSMLDSARKLKGLPRGTPIGPSPSQWGEVLALAKSAPADFAARLADTERGPCKPKQPGWEDEHWDQETSRTRTFAAWIRDALGSEPSPALVQRLAREVMDVIKREARQ